MKKRLMKRGLSLLLAVAMMFGMIQAPLFSQEVQAAATNVAASGTASMGFAEEIPSIPDPVHEPASKAIDGNTATTNYAMWKAAYESLADEDRPSVWWQVDLGKVYDISSVKMWRYYSGGRTYYNTIIVASQDATFGNEDDTVIWNAATGEYTYGYSYRNGVADEEYPETSTGREFTVEEGTQAQYVRVYMRGSDANTGNHLVEFEVYTNEEVQVDPIPVSEKPANGTTQNQPFARGTAGSDKFRIPALITTKDGTLVAAIDARWNTHSDALGIDTIVSTSADDGANWNYTFANYLGDYGNESTNPNSEKAYAATFIDPELIYDKNAGDKGTIYMLVDLYAGGYAINTAPMAPVSGNPFTDAGYLKLKASGASTYDYYLKDGKIYGTDGTEVSGYTVDGYFNLFYNDAEAGNLFFNSADQAKKPAYQVLPTTYLYLTKSTDNGATWSAPQLLDVKADDEYFYGVGPGRGIVTSDGVLMFSCYKYAGSDAQRSSVIYSTDNGATWKRTENATSSIWSSESQLVELPDGTIRMFFRNGQSCICYVDATKGTDAEGNRIYTWGDYKTTSISNHSNCQISAMMYSKKIDGKDAILVACPSNTSSRSVGKIFVGLVNSDNSMEWKYSYAGFGTGYFQYSCMTELRDGSIGILYEDCSTTDGSAVYKKIPITDIVGNNATIGGFWVEDAAGTTVTDVTMKPGDTATYSIFGETAGSLSVLSSNTDVATVALNETATAAADDTAVATFTVTANADLVGYGTSTITVSDGTDTTAFKVNVVGGDTENYEVVELRVGETANYHDTTGCYVDDETGVDENVATIEMSSGLFVLGKLATTQGSFDGSYIDLNDCLYKFTSTGTTNQYTISSTTATGATVYLNLAGTAVIPNETSSKNITLFNGDTAGTITFLDSVANSSLHFHKGSGYYFNRCSNNADNRASDTDHQFEIYKPSANSTSSNIKGFEQVTSVSDIQDGNYLIVALATNGNRYVLYPYAGGSGSNFNHVAQVIGGYYEAAVGVADDNGYADNTVGISDCLYTFEEGTTDGTYVISAQTTDGTKVYLNMNDDGKKPNKTSPADIEVRYDSAEESFKLYQPTVNNNHGHAFLHFTDTGLNFDRCGDDNCGDLHEYELFERSSSVSDSQIILGYDKVTTVEAGKQYLIAHKHAESQIYYLLNPYSGGTNYNHIAKLTDQLVETTSGTTDITITGVAPGETTAVIGNTTYYISVQTEKKEITVIAGEEYIAEGSNPKTPADSSIISTTSGQTGYKKITNEDIAQVVEGRYLIGRDTHCMTSEYQDTSSSVDLKMKALGDDGLSAAGLDAYEWIVAKVDGGYTIQNTAGKYLNVNSNNKVILSDTSQIFTLENNGAGGFGIKTGTQYLNNHQNANNYITSYNQNDGGSNLYLYRALEDTVTITGKKIGTTTLVTDEIEYTVNVVDYVDYTVLDQQIEIANALKDDTSYTEESLNNLNEVLTEATTTFQRVTSSFSSAEELKVAQDAADAMTEKLISAVRALQKKMKSISMTVGQQADYVVSGELSGYEGGELDVARVTVDGTKMTVAGLSVGFVKMMVGDTTYNVVISPIADGFPITAGTGEGTGKIVTKLTISADNSFDFNYDGTETVTWSTPEIEGVSIDKNTGTLTFDAAAVTSTVTTTVTATTASGETYTIPVIVHPAPSSADKRITNVYIDEISNLEVYYTWNCETDFIHACIGEAIYYSSNHSDGIAIDFLGAPADGYALTHMASTNSWGHYMTVHTGDDMTLDTSLKGFLNYVGDDGRVGAGVTQSEMFGEDQVMAMLYQGIIRYCDGAMGFTRKSGDANDINSRLSFQAEKLPTIEKSVHGILPADARRPGYRTYEDGMSATEGEFVYFQVTVKTYRPLTFKEGTYKSMVDYSNAIITDDVLEGASFITDKGQDTILAPDQIIPNPVFTTEDITKALNDQVWEEGESTKELTYYVAYKIKSSDLGSDLKNTADLNYNYKAQYSTGVFDVAANAEAKITVANYLEKEIVVDFGLPVETILTTWGRVGTAQVNADGEEVYDITRLKTGEGAGTATYGTVDVEEVKNTVGDTTTGWRITYTPTQTLKATDVITLYSSNVFDENNNPAAYTIKVYPASSVYYEEKFMDTSKDTDGDKTNSEWTITGTPVTGAQEAAQPGYTTALANWTANYGYDAVYAEPSNSEAVTAKTTDGKEKAAFKFTGTGVDVFANCDADTGIVMVMVKQLGADGTSTLKKMFTVDTKLNFGKIDNANAATLGRQTLNVPIVSIPEHGLDYGDYEVLLVHAPKKVKTQTTVDDVVTETTTAVATALRIDGFRVYGTLQDPEAAIVHGKDHEAAPVYLDMKDSILAGMSVSDAWAEGASENKTAYAEQLAGNLLSQIYASSGAKLTGAVVTASDSTTLTYSGADLKDFLDNTSKNELYLYPGQSLVFALDFATMNPQLALKALNGAGEYKITKAETGNASATPETVTKELKANTEMYYLLGMLKNADKTQKATTFTISNTGTSVISVTKLKVITGAAVEAFVELSAEDLVPALSVFKSETPEGGTEQLPQVQSVNRLSGSNRYETSYKVAEEYKKQLGVQKFDAVIITTGEKYADALSGSYLAVQKNAPILLTNAASVDEVVSYVKENLNAEGSVYILGGTAAVPADVYTLLDEDYEVKRLGGKDRYETNRAILEEAGVQGRELLIATGEDFADSLSASATGRPILLVKDEVTDEHRAILRKYDGSKIYIIGGERAVSAEIEQALVGHGRIFRVNGANRFETSVEVAKKFFEEPAAVTLAYAFEAPDGLCGGPLAALVNAPLILTENENTAEAKAYVQEMGIDSGYVFGGTGRISEEAVEEIF